MSTVKSLMIKFDFPETIIFNDGTVFCKEVISTRAVCCEVESICDNCPLLILLARYEFCKNNGDEKAVQ